MENHTLLLHIGIPKTGTSALQRFLFDNRECLKEYGWSYPDLKSIVGEAESYFNEFMNAIVLYKAENVLDTKSENWIRSWNYLKKELEKYNVILSSEAIFEWGDTANLLKEVIKEYQNVKVIVYLRRQDLFLESYWGQVVKIDGYVKSFEESVQEFTKYTRYLDLLHSISEIIGKENLIVRVYEKGQYAGDRNNIVSDFFDAVGINPNWADFHQEGTINKSMYGNYLEIRRIFNTLKEIDRDFPDDYRKYFLRLSNLLPKEKKVSGYFASKEEREKFLDNFKEENRIVAEQFVGNEEGILFYDMNTDIPFTGVKASSFEEDLIRLFGTIVCSEVKEIKQRVGFLEKNSKWMTEMLIDLQKKDRQIVFFGGGYKCRELLKRYSLDVAMIIDNDEKKAGCQIDGISIANPLDINNWEGLFIIITCMDTKDIEAQLRGIGLLKGKDFILAHEFLY